MALRLSHITRRFGPTVAVDDVSLEIAAGEIVALVGENGAGKTTLMRIAARELAPDNGTIDSSRDAGFVHQHFLLVDAFTIEENLELATGTRNAASLVAEAGMALGDLRRRVGDLSVGERAKLELIKAVAKHPKLLILDEPTSVLTPLETDELFVVIRSLAARGAAVVFISHKVPEVLAIATRFVVMRRGRIVFDRRDGSAEELANAMVAVSGVTAVPATSMTRSNDVRHLGGVDVASGEIVAVIGVAGNGQAELAANLRRTLRSPRVAFIPEDRTRDGLIAEMTIAENLALTGTAQTAGALIEKFAIRAAGAQQLAGTLSGGNQQKLLLARELSRNPEIIIAAEPTRGLDMESTRFVHRQLREASASGAAILLISSDLDEAFGLADAVHVIYRGRLSERLTPSDAASRVGSLMAGLS